MLSVPTVPAPPILPDEDSYINTNSVGAISNSHTYGDYSTKTTQISETMKQS